MRLDREAVLSRVSEFFRDPLQYPDLPRDIVAIWRVESKTSFKTAGDLLKEVRETQGAIYDTCDVESLRALYLVLTSKEVRDLRLYQITPRRIAWLIEYFQEKL